jgi:hypothetical protein
MAATGNFLNASITRLESLCRGKQIGTASDWFIVTNWHVLAGRENTTGQPKRASGEVPDECRFYLASLRDEALVWTTVVYPLGDSLNQTAHWFQHPTEGQDIDVGTLPIKSTEIGFAKDFMDPTGHDPDMFIDLGHELFLPGYPLGLSAGGLLPIWKRASLASSLEFGHGINRFFFVDTATREGMSGAPCLATSNWKHYAIDRPTGKVRVVERPLSWRLLGVYSGRRTPSDSFEAQIGIVWRETTIFETITGQTRASVKLRTQA